MKRITIGGLADDAFPSDHIRLPILTDVGPTADIVDGLDQAVAERKGVALIAEKGIGKSFGLDLALKDFEEVEQLAEEADASRIRRTALRLFGPRTRDRREMIEILWEAVVGMPPMRPRGRKIQEDELLKQTVNEMLRQNVAAVVIDEAENLSATAILTLRDMVSLAERMSQDRYEGDQYRAAGVGVLFVGTPDLAPRLRASGEAGHRWLRTKRLEGLDMEVASEIYLRFLPAFMTHVQQIGRKKWIEYLQKELWGEGPLALRLIENHVRNYCRRMFAQFEGLSDREELVFDKDIFEYTHEELGV